MASKINNIHDKFIKELLSDRDVAIAFLQEYLPLEVVSALNFTSLKYQNTSYLSKELKDSYSDMVWSINSVSDEHIKICLLLEHKSYVETHAAFQIL